MLEKSKDSKSESNSITTSNDSSSKDNTSDAKETMRKTFKKSLLEKLKTRMEKNNNGTQLLPKELDGLVNKIEDEFHIFFNSNEKGYREKYKAIIMNVIDEKNDSFFLKILHGKIAPKDLPRMKNEDMASDEKIAERQREREKDIERCVDYSNELAKNCVSLVLSEHVEKGLPKINEDDFKEIANNFLEDKKEETLPKNPFEEINKNLSMGLSNFLKTSVDSTILLDHNLEVTNQATLNEDSDLHSKITIAETDHKGAEQAIETSPIKTYSSDFSSYVLPSYVNLSVCSPMLLRDTLTGTKERENELIVISEVPKHSNSVISKDTTHEHGNHVFDINCNACTYQIKGSTSRQASR